MVVIEPFTTPNLSCSTFTTGPKQLVVQLAFEMTLCLAGSYILSLTPSTRVTSSFLAGAEMITFFTGPRRCFSASFLSVNIPVDSTTIWAPTEAQSSAAGSLVAKILMRFPQTTIESPSTFTSWCKVPRIESYFNKCASVFVSVRSLAATNSMFERSRPARTTLRPMRPKPLMPTLMDIQLQFIGFWFLVSNFGGYEEIYFTGNGGAVDPPTSA